VPDGHKGGGGDRVPGEAGVRVQIPSRIKKGHAAYSREGGGESVDRGEGRKEDPHIGGKDVR